MFARSRCRAGTAALASLAAVALATGALSAWPVHAIADVTTTTAKCPTPEIIGGVSATGATVATPGAKPRTLNKDQATAFMQTWLAYSVFGKPPPERPPAGVPVSRLEVATMSNGQPSTLLIFYATDGTKVWVGAPAPAPVPPPPNDQKWIRAPKPKETSAAFAGNMNPICTDPVTVPSTTTASSTTIGQATKSTDSSSSGAPWVLIVVGIVVVVGGGGVVVALRSRRRAA